MNKLYVFFLTSSLLTFIIKTENSISLSKTHKETPHQYVRRQLHDHAKIAHYVSIASFSIFCASGIAAYIIQKPSLSNTSQAISGLSFLVFLCAVKINNIANKSRAFLR